MNRLANSASLYLRQHAHNPVEWYPWGKEAIARAKKEDKPIFLSIGYSTCYWCHVMEREIFENEEIAPLMNKDFINIKVDREERPDLDEIYMSARQIITQQGGWPNNLFLTPDLKPFYAGGTFAADERYGQPGFPQILEMVKQSWQLKRDDVEEAADNITRRMGAILSRPSASGTKINFEIIENLAQHLGAVHDPVNGGFFQAPKFPQETYLLFLIDYYRITKDQKALDIVARSLDMMAAGGIFDHVGGGFHRYSTDAKWQVPHFEKMLYNQALLAQVYVAAYEVTGKPYYEYIARSTLDFVAEKMTGRGGQFFSAFDAENEGVEGAYYVWSEEELKDILSDGAFNFLSEVYGLAELPHFSGHRHPDGKVLYAKKPLDDMATERGKTYDDLQAQLNKVLGKLLSVRNEREEPALDTKVIASWNGMMIKAFAEASAVFGESRYLTLAENAANFIISNMVAGDNTVSRIWSDGKLSVDGFLEDYVFLTEGLLAIARTSGDKQWIGKAIDIINRADDFYYDKGQGGFFFTRGAKDLIIRLKAADDSAIPSANAVMAHALVDMNELTQGTKWEHGVWLDRANETVDYFANSIKTSPVHYVHMLHALLRMKQGLSMPELTTTYAAPIGEFKGTSQGQKESKLSSANYVRIETKWDDDKLLPGKDSILNVTLKIAEGWHINPNPAPRGFLIPTSMDIRSELVEFIRADYPNPSQTIITGSGETLEVFSDEVKIPVTVQLKKWVKPGDFVDLNLMVTFQACNSSTCLEPTNQLISMSLIASGK